MSQLPPANSPPPPAGNYVQQVVVHIQGASGLAIFSGLAGIFSWFLCPFVGAIAAVIAGHIALADLRRSPRPGRGWALIGVILGYVQIAWYVLVVIPFLLGAYQSKG